MRKLKFRNFLFLSLLVHCAFVLLLITLDSEWSLFSSKKPFLQQSIRVDVVDLPDIMPTQKKTTRTKKSHSNTRKKTVISKKKKQADKKKVLKKPKKKERKKKSQKKERKKKSQKKEQQNKFPKQENATPQKNKIYKGNQISKGSGTSGEAKVRTNIYITEITGIIKSYWKIPSYIKDQDLQTELEVKINNQGNITKRKIIKSSGNPIFDLKVLEAIKNAEPFPEPPISSRELIKDGIIFVLNSKEI